MRRDKALHVPLEEAEARLLDGALDPEAARRTERLLAADPLRRAALERDREAIGLWVEEARTTGADPAAMADRVLAGLSGATTRPVRTGEEFVATRTALAWAAAALLLLGAGLVGTWSLESRRAQASPPEADAPARPVAEDPDAPLLDGVAQAVRAGMVRRSSGDPTPARAPDGR